nr:condensation domain-containing protein [uncultured bacterium]
MSDTTQRFETLSPQRRALLEKLLKEKGKSAQPPASIPRGETIGPQPLSHAQERMWFLDQLEPGSPFYNMFQAVSLKGRLDVGALEQALSEIVRRHEALRTTFANDEGQPVQITSAASSLRLEAIDLASVPEAERADAAQDHIRKEAAKPFDLVRGPLLRATLLRLADDDHVLLLPVHHIVADGWSLGVLIRELADLYEAFAASRPSPLADLAIQYADYARWQRGPERQARLDAQLDYWEQHLAGAPPLVEVPTDRPRHAAHGFGGARQRFWLGRELSDEVAAFARGAGVSLFMTLLACWKAQLARESGQSDIVVGTRTAGRVRAELEGLIGLFVNVLALRTEVAAGESFRALVGRVQRAALEGFERQEAPFERLVQRVGPERGAGRNPLFNVMFVLQNAPQPAIELPELSLSLLKVESTTAKYDLDLTLWESDEGLTGWLEYSTELFDAATAARMTGRFQRFVEQLVRHPDVPVGEIELLDECERRQVLVECNETAAEFPAEQPVHELFAAQAARTPDAVAVADARQQISYRELNRRANRLAHHLRARGVGPEVAVGVLLGRSVETVLTLLAIYKAGGVYVPLDPNYPASHLQLILRQTRPPVVITDALLAEQLPEVEASVIRLDADWPEMMSHSMREPRTCVGPDNLAYIMYTSGSTGQPKGVAVAHRQLLNRLHWMWREFPFGEGETLCQRTTANFSVSMWELLGGLLCGCRTVVVSDEQTKDTAQLIAAMERHEVTRAVLVPSLLRTLLEVEPGLGRRLSSARLWSVCGEPLSPELAARFAAQFSEARLVNQYGASELNDVCFDEVDAEGLCECEARGYGSVPVGRPVSNLGVYLLDAMMCPVGFGHRGEIYVRSVSPARGYVGQPEETAERFVPDAVSGASGARLYRTGDVGRRLADGRIEVVGRADEQVKVRGMRVEVKGVEALLRAHEAVRDVAVAARREGGEVTGLVAYVVAGEQGAVGVRELREWVRGRAPEQMVPGVMVEVAELPRLPNGKVDRRALPDLMSVAFGEQKGFVAPQTLAERTIAEVWQQVLGVGNVDVHHNFFELGGHSLALARVQSKLQTAFNKSVSMIELFKNPTISALARHLSEGQAEDLTLQKAQERVNKRRRAGNRQPQRAAEQVGGR